MLLVIEDRVQRRQVGRVRIQPGVDVLRFPESHAASFALITYASAWLKCHEPAAFAASLINSLPMGFYSAGQILQDVRRHGIRVLPVDVRYSDWDCTLEFPRSGVSENPDIRLGFRMIGGFRESEAVKISLTRQRGVFRSVADLGDRTRLDPRHLAMLADAGALKGLASHRHRARWNVTGVEKPLPLFDGVAATPEPTPVLPVPTPFQDMQADYATTQTTLGRHPLSFIRGKLSARRYRRSSELADLPHGRHVRYAGMVRMRQRRDLRDAGGRGRHG